MSVDESTKCRDCGVLIRSIGDGPWRDFVGFFTCVKSPTSIHRAPGVRPLGLDREPVENGTSDDTWAYVTTDGPKMLRETLCAAQNRIWSVEGDSRNLEHSRRLGRLINACDWHRPLDNANKHGDLHTPTCGCEDKVNEEASALACAWSDYRSAYGAEAIDYKAFKAGWEAAQGVEMQGVQR